MTHRTLFPLPDENRALEQLERFHREIVRARRDRERAGAEFDGFVRNFQGQGQESTAAAPAGRQVPRPSGQPMERPVTPPEPAAAIKKPDSGAATQTGAHAPAALAPNSAAAAERDVPSAMAAPPRARSRGWLVAAGVLLLAAVGALLLWQRSQTAPPPETPVVNTRTAPALPAPGQPSRATPARPEAARPAAPPAAQQPAAPAPAVSPSTIALTTIRPVWMRVIVDGERVLEREVPAGQHLTYIPTSGLVIRAGDAGGVRVKIGNGPEEVLGRDAFPVTRRFSVPKP